MTRKAGCLMLDNIALISPLSPACAVAVQIRQVKVLQLLGRLPGPRVRIRSKTSLSMKAA